MKKIILIADPHLSRTHPFSQFNWEVVIEEIKLRKPDLVVCLGDVAVNGPDTPGDLIFARTQFERIGTAFRSIAGNHDIGDSPIEKVSQPVNNETITLWKQLFGDLFWVEILEDWKIIGLDSQIMGGGLDVEAEQ